MKVIIHKKTGEFGQYIGEGKFGFSSLPYIFPNTMNLKDFKTYVKSIEGCELETKDLIVKNVKVEIID